MPIKNRSFVAHATREFFGFDVSCVESLENRKILAAAEELGLNQSQLNDFVNDNAEVIFEIHSKKFNLSGAGEDKSNDLNEVIDLIKEWQEHQ